MLGLVAQLACHPAAPAATEPPPAEASPTEAADPEPAATTSDETEPTLRLHLSFDDAPWAGDGAAEADPAAVMARNEAIVGTLREQGVPASVFFNCDRLKPGERSVELWAENGFAVGNHTSSHAHLSKTPLDEWMSDVSRCHEALQARLPEPPRWFRYPYLDQGDTQELRDEAKARLTALGYANAHVTVATTEWLIAFAYAEAKRRGDQALQDELVAAYRQHMVEAVEQGRALAEHEVGRVTAQVTLFHVNELAADHLGEVIDDFRAKGWELVSIEEALDDPVFDLPDRYVGGGGISWLARIHDVSEPRPPYWFGREEQRLTERYGDLWKPKGAGASEE